LLNQEGSQRTAKPNKTKIFTTEDTEENSEVAEEKIAGI